MIAFLRKRLRAKRFGKYRRNAADAWLIRVQSELADEIRASRREGERDMNTTTFATRDEAIQRVIVDPIEASGEIADARTGFDIDAIAAEVLGDYEQGYTCLVDSDEFWRVVERHAE